MPKLKLDKDALKGFFVLHIEKIVLVIVLLIFVVFVYTGSALEGIDSDQTPESLAKLADSANSNINRDSWDNWKVNHEPPTGLETQAKEASAAMPDALYSPIKPYTPATRSSGLPRIDPELLPPQDIEAYPVVGSLAHLIQPDEEDPLVDAENSEPRIKKTKKRRKAALAKRIL